MNNFTIIKHDKSGIVQYALSDSKIKRKVVAACGFLLLSVFALGSLVGAYTFATNGEQNEKIKELQVLVDLRQKELIDHRKSVQNDIDSMTLQIGKLMAQTTRLNALGSQLTVVAEIDQDEFNLTEAPGIGGPEASLVGTSNTPQSLYTHLFNLEDTVVKQQENFNILAQLLNEQSLDQNATPHIFPLEKGWISSYYGKRIDPFTGQPSTHPGIDYSGGYNSKILAAADGVVVWAGKRSTYGNMGEIDHGNGYMTRYAHADKVNVQLGQKVSAGDAIAIMGKTGRATSEHLHFEVLKNGRKINPTPFIHS